MKTVITIYVVLFVVVMLQVVAIVSVTSKENNHANCQRPEVEETEFRRVLRT